MPIPGKRIEVERTYLDGRATLILGRNEEYDVEADGVVTDPPYGIKHKNGSSVTFAIEDNKNGKRWSTARKQSIVGDDKPFDPFPYLKYPCVAFTGAQHFYSRLPKGGMLHCWNKRRDFKPLDQADCDMIWVSKPHDNATSSRVLHLTWSGSIRESGSEREYLHPTQKPIELMKWMIDLCDIPLGGRIYDPYMGSGTTGLAAIQCGYDFIGIETVEEYFEAACSRFEKL